MVYIVGDITKDVYLRLDNHRNKMYADEDGMYWLDLPFDNKIHRYFRRASVYGGTAVSADVLKRFGVEPEIAGTKTLFDEKGNFIVESSPYRTYRYVLCKDDDTAIFAPSNVYDTVWKRPEDRPDYVYVDRPCVLDPKEREDMMGYLEESGVQLAVWMNRGMLADERIVRRLSERAELLFVAPEDLGLEELDNGHAERIVKKFHDMGAKAVVVISRREVYMSVGGEIRKVGWSLGGKAGLMTSLTTKAILASSVLGAYILGEDVQKCLLLAKYNVENSTLNTSNSIETLREMIISKEYEVKSMESSRLHSTTMMSERGARGEVVLAPINELATGAELGQGPFDGERVEVEPSGDDIRSIAKRLVAEGKGILAADESGGSIHKKFEQYGIEDTEQNRRDYRNIFFTTEGLENYVNGVILFDETAKQRADDGRIFVEFLGGKGIIPGIKVDKGLEDLPNFSGEKVTLGLDDLKERLKEYYEMGCRFAKWRAALEITDKTPNDGAIAANVQALARYALDCQEAGIVPIVEPEVVYDGYYTMEQCREVTSRVLYALFNELDLMRVDLKATILKCNMCLAGKKYERQSTPEEVGRVTAEVLKAQVPEDVAGVVFLSGGQTVTQATENLQAVTDHGPFAWPVTFSYARALQDPAVETWRGDVENVPAAREAFKARLAENTRALTKSGQ